MPKPRENDVHVRTEATVDIFNKATGPLDAGNISDRIVYLGQRLLVSNDLTKKTCDGILEEYLDEEARRCEKCGKKFPFEEVQADHITPWSKGGLTVPDICQMLCRG